MTTTLRPIGAAFRVQPRGLKTDTDRFIQVLWDLRGFAGARLPLDDEHLVLPHSLDQIVPERVDGQDLLRFSDRQLFPLRLCEFGFLLLEKGERCV